jgi:hypothetical protein
MGIENIIKNNPNWNNSVESVYINNNIFKTKEEINKGLEEEFKNQEENNRRKKLTKAYIEKMKEKERTKKEKEEEKERKYKGKYHNDYF